MAFLSIIGALGPILLEVVRFMITKGMMSAETSRKFIDAIEAYSKESANFSVRMQQKYQDMVKRQLEIEAEQAAKG